MIGRNLLQFSTDICSRQVSANSCLCQQCPSRVPCIPGCFLFHVFPGKQSEPSQPLISLQTTQAQLFQGHSSLSVPTKPHLLLYVGKKYPEGTCVNLQKFHPSSLFAVQNPKSVGLNTLCPEIHYIRCPFHVYPVQDGSGVDQPEGRAWIQQDHRTELEFNPSTLE